MDRMTPYEAFMWMFPTDMLNLIVSETNIVLDEYGYSTTTPGEILKFFGVLVLMTRFEFRNRAALWKNTGMNKYMPGPQFGKFMTRNRFELLRRSIRFCRRSATPMSVDRWAPVVDFVNAINKHRRQNVIPSESICVDESMSRWYGMGGKWISKGLPHYVALDRKPENGCELKTAACGRSGILLRIEIVRSSDDPSMEPDNGENHGTEICKRLVSPWFGMGRIVCADSYFASVATAQALHEV